MSHGNGHERTADDRLRGHQAAASAAPRDGGADGRGAHRAEYGVDREDGAGYPRRQAHRIDQEETTTVVRAPNRSQDMPAPGVAGMRTNATWFMRPRPEKGKTSNV